MYSHKYKGKWYQLEDIDFSDCKTSNQAASKMFMTRAVELPLPAFDAKNKLCREFGGCGEVILSAFNYYAQYFLDLPPEDELEKITDDFIEFFDNYPKNWVGLFCIQAYTQDGEKRRKTFEIDYKTGKAYK